MAGDMMEAEMKAPAQRLLALILVAIALTGTAHAEPRWCSTAGKDPTNKFIYPPIARAARVTGVVLLRMEYVPNGKVVRIEPISGPRLLSDTLADQLMDWTMRTDASGDQPCVTLVIAKFTMAGLGQQSPGEATIEGLPSILRLSAEAEPMTIDVVIEDPAPIRGFKRFRSEVDWRIRRLVDKVFGAQ